MADDTPDDPGGAWGGAAPGPALPGHGIRDRRLARRALMEGWNLPPHLRNQILRHLLDILDPEHVHEPSISPSHRERIGAAKVLAAMFNSNIELRKVELVQQKILLDRKRVELEERRLGLLAKSRNECPTPRDALTEAEQAAIDYRPPERPDPNP